MRRVLTSQIIRSHRVCHHSLIDHRFFSRIVPAVNYDAVSSSKTEQQPWIHGQIDRPLCITSRQFELPARSKWLTLDTEDGNPSLRYLHRYADTTVPLEFTSKKSEDGHEDFGRFDAPLGLLLKYLETASTKTAPTDQAKASMYLAQCSITDLPIELQNDLPMPAMLNTVDIYQSSIWIGVAPTNTPLHRDPHPNLFVQMAGQKRVRLFEPDVGLSIFQKVRALVGNTLGMDGRIRGEEMMVGKEKEELEKVVWGPWEDDTPGQEVLLPEGSGLVIPQGWWHSVKGVEGGKINASVNWWFRPRSSQISNLRSRQATDSK